MSQKVRLAVDKTDSVRQPGTRRGCELLDLCYPKAWNCRQYCCMSFFSPYSFFELTSPDIYIYYHIVI